LARATRCISKYLPRFICFGYPNSARRRDFAEEFHELSFRAIRGNGSSTSGRLRTVGELLAGQACQFMTHVWPESIEFRKESGPSSSAELPNDERPRLRNLRPPMPQSMELNPSRMQSHSFLSTGGGVLELRDGHPFFQNSRIPGQTALSPPATGM